MPLIDDTYFVEECNLAGLGDAINRERLNNYIGNHERDFLQQLFGDFGVLFTLSANSNSSRFVNLINNYIKYAEVRYMYYGFVEDSNAVATSSGKGTMKSENAIKARPDIAMVKAWNQMIKKLQKMYEYMFISGLYPEFTINMATALPVKNTFDL